MPAKVCNTETGQMPSGNRIAVGNNAFARTKDDNCLEASSERKESTVPDGGWGWMVVLASFNIHVIVYGIAYSFGVYLEDFVDYFKCSKSAVGGIGSLVIGTIWCSGPIVSALTNKFGCRVVCAAGGLIASVGFVVSIWAPNVWFMYISFGCVTGLGLGMAYLPAIVAVCFRFQQRRSLAMGIAVCGSGIGTFVLAPLADALLSNYSWKGTMLIEAGIVLNCIPCAMVFPPSKASHSNVCSNNGTITKTIDFRLFLDVVFILFAVSNLLACFGCVVPIIFLPIRGLSLGFSSNFSSLLISVVGISDTIGRVVFGFVSNVKGVNRLILYNTALVICGISSVISVLLWTFPSLICYSFVFGCFYGVFVCLTPLVLVDLLGLDKVSNAYGLVLLFQGVGAITGPPFAGWLYDISDNFENAFYVTGTCIFISGAMLYLIPCIQRRRQLSHDSNEQTPVAEIRQKEHVALNPVTA